MSRSNSCIVCTYLIELVAGIMTSYIFIYLDDAIVMRFALSMLYIPAALVLVDAKSNVVRFLVYLMLTAVCLWGVFYAIYWRRPFGFSLIFAPLSVLSTMLYFPIPPKRINCQKYLSSMVALSHSYS